MIKNCIVCGRAFDITGKCSNKITCSAECRKIRSKKQREARYAEIKKNRLPKIIECPVCGKRTEKKNGGQKYCSPECQKYARNKRERAKYRSTEYKKEYENPPIKKPTSNSEKEAKRRRAKSQININMTNELARKHNQSYGQYQGMKYAAKDGSILDQPWAQELMKKKQEKKCRI